ncbi:RNase P/MRP p29 subunit [Phlyctochytrium arcticum]|nr:RNase P/MRP p29 subunit [Phlyctochytrium arcticum]
MPPKRKVQTTKAKGSASHEPAKRQKAQQPAATATPVPSTAPPLNVNPQAQGPLYEALPAEVLNQALETLEYPPSTISRPFTKPFVESIVSTTQNAALNYESKVKGKVLSVENPPPTTAEKHERVERRELVKQRRRSKKMTAKERKATGAWDIPATAKKFEVFAPLHKMWMGYMTEILDSNHPASIQQKLLRADFHGANMTVTQSKCPTNIGISGIVIKETENMFYIITTTNAVKVIPKRNSIFTLGLPRKTCGTIYGNHLIVRPADRSSRKFKEKPTVAL